MGGSLTKAQRAALAAMPDWIGGGLPLAVIGVSRDVAMRLYARGLAERERPNEEWPYVYASTPAGRAALGINRND